MTGHQDGAEISTNPKKPGRPCHVVHTYWVGNLRLVLDAEVQKGKAHAAKYGLPRLRDILERLPSEQRPALVRGDSAFGNEGIMAALEGLEQPYLFKLRQSAGVKRLIERQWSCDDWQMTGQGFDTVEASLRLSGWSQARRVVVLRRRITGRLLAEEGQANKESGQAHLHFADTPEHLPVWEYSVLVSNTEYALEAIGQFYRDRADCENGFDELKNQWGSRYTPHDLERCNLSARAVALIYNGWSWYARLAHPKTRLEAITNCPLLLADVARLTQHDGQCRLLLTLTHAASDRIKTMIANVRKGLRFVSTTAPQLPKTERWIALGRYITRQFLANRPRNPILSARLNRKGELRFPRPAGKFHVLMEEGPGQTVELDERDVGQDTGIRWQETETQAALHLERCAPIPAIAKAEGPWQSMRIYGLIGHHESTRHDEQAFTLAFSFGDGFCLCRACFPPLVRIFSHGGNHRNRIRAPRQYRKYGKRFGRLATASLCRCGSAGFRAGEANQGSL